MNNTNINSVSLSDSRITGCDDYYTLRYIRSLDFSSVDEVLALRVFDLMNLSGISAEIAEEIMYILYKALNYNETVDFGMKYGSIKQPFDYAAFRENHKKHGEITVGDIVLANDMNEAALSHIFKITARAFYKSPEYSCRRYRYRDKEEYMRSLSKKTEGTR